MQERDLRLRSPDGVYRGDDVEAALARVFGAGVRPLRFEEALFDAMLDGWRAQQAARYLKPKTVKADVQAARSFSAHADCWPWGVAAAACGRLFRRPAVGAAVAAAGDGARLPDPAEGVSRLRHR
jgi:hypothetical protein